MEGLRTAARPAGARVGVRTLIVSLIVLAAAATLLVRLPTTLSTLNANAHRNNSYDALGRTLAAADSLDIDNDFVVAALELLPTNATFMVATPPGSDATVSPLTVEALPGYLRFVLLPRREVDVKDAQFVLCYRCSATSVPTGTRWVWTSADGTRIGRLRR